MIKIYLYDKSVVCPVCKHQFMTKKVKSKSIKVVKRDSDFKAEYEYDNPTFYGVNVCPNCGHARFESDFNDVNEAIKKTINDKISLKWKSKDFCQIRSLNDAIEVHKLALLNYNVSHYKPSVIAKVCLRLSWFYRDMNSPLAEKFAVHARQTYEEAYMQENLDDNPKEELTILYLLGELNRREGNFKKAMEWFSLGLKSPIIKNEKFLSESLKEQMVIAKNEFKKQKEANNE